MFDISIELALIICFGLMLVGALWMFWKSIYLFVQWNLFKRGYPVKLHIYKKRGDGLVFQQDKGTVVKDRALDKEFYDTVKNGKIPRLETDWMTADQTVMLYEVKPGEFMQVDLNQLGAEGRRLKLKPLSENRKEWFASEIKKKDKYKTSGLLAAILNHPVVIVFAVGLMAMGIMTSFLLPIMDSATQISADNAKIIEKINAIDERNYQAAASSPDDAAAINRTMNKPPF